MKGRFQTSAGVKTMGRSAYYQMLKKVSLGELVKIKAGVYASYEQLADTMIDVEAVVPGGVLCLFTAWNVYNLTTTVPQAYHIAVKRGRKVKDITFPKIQIHHVSSEIFDLGAECQNIRGYDVRIYDKERCVCDAIKYRNKIGIDVCAEVLNEYLNLRERNIPKLMQYAKVLRVENILNRYLEVKL